MKSAIRLVAGASLRRQNNGAIGLAMLVALSTALVLTSLAGARRTATSFERFRDLVESRLHLLPPFRRRLVFTPLALHHPRVDRGP